MLGGLIAGALGGGANAVNGLADQAIKEALDAKKSAYDKGVLEWRLQEARTDATTDFERQQGNTVLQSQLAGEREQQNNIFTAGEKEKDRAAQIKAASISAARGDRVTASERAQEQLLGLKNQYLSEADPEARKKLAEDIAFFEGRAAAKPDYVTLKTGLDGGEKRYMQTPQGLVEMNIAGTGGADPNAVPGAETKKVNPAKDRSYSKLLTTSETSGVSGGGTGVNPKPPPEPKAPDGGNPQQVKEAFNASIRNAMKGIQQQIVAAPNEQEKIRLAAQYSGLHAQLKK